MDKYNMKKLGNKFPDNETLTNTVNAIMVYLRGNKKGLTEIRRQFCCWGANAYRYICSDDGCYGIQFRVTGMLHRGRVRIYYNPATDYFDVELLKAIKDEVVYGCEDLDFSQLHNVLHQHIERTDDPEV